MVIHYLPGLLRVQEILATTYSNLAGESNENYSYYLRGFFDKIQLINHNCEKQNEFMLFVVEGYVIGYVHSGFADHLRKFRDVFIFPKDETFGSKFGCHVTLHSTLRTAKDRTIAIGDVVKSLGEELIPAINIQCQARVKCLNTGGIFQCRRNVCYLRKRAQSLRGSQ